VRVETHLYSLPDQQLIWAATTETRNPGGTQQLIDETADNVRETLNRAPPAIPVSAR